MNLRREVALIGLPAFVMLTLLLVAVTRRMPAEIPAKGPGKVPEQSLAPLIHQTESAPIYKRVVLPKPAPAEVLKSASDEALFRETYRNYRTAVGTGNTVLQEALKKALSGDRELAIRLAQEDLARSSSDLDREITAHTLEALRR